MEYKEFAALGFYEPGFLHMRINTDEELTDLNKLAEEESTKSLFSTFFHEYIHFLQEVSTTSGLLTAGSYIDLIKDVNWKVRHQDKKEFDTPVDINNDYNSQSNLQLAKIYRGDVSTENYAKYTGFTFEEIQIIDNRNGNVKKPKKYTVYYYDSRGRNKSFHFGSTCLKEYVAHSIQKLHYPTIQHPDIPYVISELIAGNEYPPIALKPLFILALCDASLMSLHPADLFFNTLKNMRETNFVPQSIKDVYSFTLGNVRFNDDNQEIGIYELFQKIKNFTLNQLQDSLVSDIFSKNYRWLEYVIEQAVMLRVEKPEFMTELVKENTLTPLFYEIVRRLGTPFFTNINGKGGFIPPATISEIPDQPYQLLVFKEVLSIYFGNTKCSLFDFCKGRPDKDITNEHCERSPWLRATDDNLCPFGQLWKTWGLTGKIPVKK